MTRSERTLWRRWVERRDGEAFAALVRRHARFVYDFARRVAGNAADAEDLTQEAYLKLAEAKEFGAVGLRAFLGRRVVLGARMLKRAALARRRHESQVLHPRGAGGPEEIARREEAQKALDLLPAGERRAVELRFLHDLSYGEIGEVLGTTEEAARMRVHRGLERVRARFGASACLAALALFEPPARMLASTAKTALLTGGVIVAQATGKKVATLVGLALLLAILGTAGVHLAGRGLEQQSAARAPLAAEPGSVPGPDGEATDPSAPTPPRPPRITGVVVNADGAPVPGATVRVYRYVGHREWIETATDRRGAFAFDTGRPQRRCPIEARHPSYSTTRAEADTDTESRLVLEPGVPVRVEVQGGGRPIRDARVAATADDATLLCDPAYRTVGEGVTDARGVAELRVPAGRWEFWAAAPGWAPKLAPPLVCAIDRPQEVRLELEPGGIIEGRAHDGKGAVVAGARVVVQASPGFRATTTTDLQGNYVVEHVPLVNGPWIFVVADHPDHGVARDGCIWAPSEGQRLRADLFFWEGARVYGVALDATGAPVPDRQVICAPRAPDFHVLYGYPWMDDRWPFACTTDARGRFEMKGLPPGDATLYLRPDLRVSIGVKLASGGTHGPVELRLPGVAARGRVLDSDGRPVADASIYPGEVVTDAEGRFAVATRPSEIVVEAEGHVPFLHAVEGDEIEVRLPANAVAGTVIGPGGDGIENVTLRLQTQIGRTVHQTEARTDALGRFRFRGAGNGFYTLDADVPGRELVGGGRDVRGARQDVLLVLATPGEAEERRVRGTVVDDAGNPIDTPVEYRSVDTETRFQHRAAPRAGQPGGFVCERLEPVGRTKLVFHVRGFLPSEPIEVRFDGRTPVEPLIVRLRRGAEVEVLVREEDGTPVARALVRGHAAGGINERTDRDGRCVLTGLPQGQNRITASHPHLADVSDAFVEATAGVRQRVEFRGKPAGAIVVKLVPAEHRARKSLCFRLLDARGAVVREERIEAATLLEQQHYCQRDFAVTAAGTYRVRCEVDGVALPEVVAEARLRETTWVALKPPP